MSDFDWIEFAKAVGAGTLLAIGLWGWLVLIVAVLS